MRKVNWLLVGILSFVIMMILFGTGMLMGDWRNHEWGMMGPNSMKENWYAPIPSPLGWVGTIFMLLFPAGFLLLVVFGVVWLVHTVNNSRRPSH